MFSKWIINPRLENIFIYTQLLDIHNIYTDILHCFSSIWVLSSVYTFNWKVDPQYHDAISTSLHSPTETQLSVCCVYETMAVLDIYEAVLISAANAHLW